MNITRNAAWYLGACALACVSALASAAAPRTFVASNGNDANPCSLVSPCRSFGAALSQTLNGGEIVVLDSAGYGPVTIGQSVKIASPPGVYAGIASGGDGVQVNAPNVKVTLRGLTINAGGRGIFVTSAAAGSVVELYSLNVSGSGSAGIRQEADSRLYIADTNVSGMGECYSADTTSGTARMTIERSTAQDCYFGYYAGGNARMVISNSSVFGRGLTNNDSYAGFIGEGSPIAGGYIACDGCLATNTQFGIVGTPLTNGSPSQLRVSNSVFFKNDGGVNVFGTSVSTSFGNNRIYDNGPTYGNGVFTTTVAPY